MIFLFLFYDFVMSVPRKYPCTCIKEWSWGPKAKKYKGEYNKEAKLEFHRGGEGI